MDTQTFIHLQGAPGYHCSEKSPLLVAAKAQIQKETIKMATRRGKTQTITQVTTLHTSLQTLHYLNILFLIKDHVQTHQSSILDFWSAQRVSLAQCLNLVVLLKMSINNCQLRQQRCIKLNYMILPLVEFQTVRHRTTR